VLADPDARAEVVAPISSAIVTSNGLPPDTEPFVTAQVDRVLRDPAGARAFVDPFAGSWARMLGEDDPRPTEFDLAPLVDVLVATTPGLDAAGLPTDRFVVPAVPLPRSDVPGVGTTRRAIAATTIPLAILALAGLLVGLVSAERRWVMRRFGLWAVLAGAAWVALPPMITWAARRWATGADAVIAVAVEEGVAGLRPTAIALVLVGLATYAGSLLIPTPIERPQPAPRQQPAPPPRRVAAAPARAATTATSAATRTVRVPTASPAAPTPTAVMPSAEMPGDRRPDAAGTDGDSSEGSDPLWDYYS
jgi:hypothetical protein